MCSVLFILAAPNKHMIFGSFFHHVVIRVARWGHVPEDTITVLMDMSKHNSVLRCRLPAHYLVWSWFVSEINVHIVKESGTCGRSEGIALFQIVCIQTQTCWHKRKREANESDNKPNCLVACFFAQYVTAGHWAYQVGCLNSNKQDSSWCCSQGVIFSTSLVEFLCVPYCIWREFGISALWFLTVIIPAHFHIFFNIKTDFLSMYEHVCSNPCSSFCRQESFQPVSF